MLEIADLFTQLCPAALSAFIRLAQFRDSLRINGITTRICPRSGAHLGSGAHRSASGASRRLRARFDARPSFRDVVVLPVSPPSHSHKRVKVLTLNMCAVCRLPQGVADARGVPCRLSLSRLFIYLFTFTRARPLYLCLGASAILPHRAIRGSWSCAHLVGLVIHPHSQQTATAADHRSRMISILDTTPNE